MTHWNLFDELKRHEIKRIDILPLLLLWMGVTVTLTKMSLYYILLLIYSIKYIS